MENYCDKCDCSGCKFRKKCPLDDNDCVCDSCDVSGNRLTSECFFRKKDRSVEYVKLKISVLIKKDTPIDKIKEIEDRLISQDFVEKIKVKIKKIKGVDEV